MHMVGFIIDERDAIVIEDEGIDDALEKHRFCAVRVWEEVVVRHLLHEMLLPVELVLYLCTLKLFRQICPEERFETRRLDQLVLFLRDDFRKL